MHAVGHALSIAGSMTWKYYGAKMAGFILVTFYAAMAIAGYLIEVVFGGLGLIPGRASAKIPDQGVAWDYTTWLNIAFFLLAAVLLVRFARSGGLPMLRMMNGAPDAAHDHGSHGGHEHGTHAGATPGPAA